MAHALYLLTCRITAEDKTWNCTEGIRNVCITKRDSL